MPLRERAYYGLDEIEARLKLTRRELLYLVENGLLKASVRVWDALIEEGEYDRVADGQTFRLPTDQRRFSGLLDLRPKDAYRLFRDQPGRHADLDRLHSHRFRRDPARAVGQMECRLSTSDRAFNLWLSELRVAAEEVA